MQGAYGGLIVVLIYAGFNSAVEEQYALITEDNKFILTELSQEIQVEV